MQNVLDRTHRVINVYVGNLTKRIGRHDVPNIPLEHVCRRARYEERARARVADCRVGRPVFPGRHVPGARQTRGVRTGGPQRAVQVQTGLPHGHRDQAYQRAEQFLRPR